MKIIWAFIGFMCVLMTFVPDAQSSVDPSHQFVRVRLMTISKRFQLSGMSLRFQNLAQIYRPVAIPQTGQAEVRVLHKDGKKFWSLRLNNQDHEHLFTEKYLMIQGDSLRAGMQTLPSKILLTQNGKDKMDVIGVVPLEEYITGVLSSEMPSSWPLETLKAQAVAIRSYTLAVMNERQDRAYHVESSVLDQVFRHVMDQDDDKKIKKAMQAVRETEGVTLLGPDKKVLKAFYHADCGGHTTTARNVWKSGVDAGVAIDESCPTGPHSQWKLTLTKQELERRLHIYGLQSIRLIRNTADSRVQSVKVAANNDEELFSANDFRQMVGFQDLRSTLFTAKDNGATVQFAGQGFGHGVGLCQWGSRAMGIRGAKYTAILKHYYPLAKIN